MAAPASIGGSFAPPLNETIIANYRALIAQVDPSSQLRDCLDKALACIDKWWELPESEGTPKPHPLNGARTKEGRRLSIQIVPLEEQHQKTLWELIPWDDELDMWAEQFETISATDQKELRDAAFHILWHVVELARDREPITTDKI